MVKCYWLLFFCLLSAQMLSAQTVETVVIHPKIIDGIHVDKAGNIYTTPGGLMGGTAIGKAFPNGDFDPNFKSGFNGGIDIDQDVAGRLYVTNYDDNTLKRFDPAPDQVTTLATDLDGPAGVTLDANGNIYLTCFGAPPTYNGNQVIRVNPNGVKEVWLESADFFRPQGITFDDEGYLWLANTPTGKIFKIDTLTKSKQLMLELGGKVGNIVYRQKDEQLYFASQGHHRIYRMDKQGNINTLAGSGIIGSNDGDAQSAQFNKPLGLGFTFSEDTLYVAEAGKLRRILDIDFSTYSNESGTDEISLRIIPNPSTGSAKVELPSSMTNGLFHLSVADGGGRVVFERKILPSDSIVMLDSLDAGTWYIRLFSDKEILVEKVLVF